MGKISKRKFKQSLKSGLPPGTLVHTGTTKLQDARISVFEYDSESINQYEVDSFHQCPDIGSTAKTVWINVDGVHEIELVQELEKKYALHPLVLEDIVNTVQRPKFEDYEKYYYIVLKNLLKKQNSIIQEQISLILLPGMVISFQENMDFDIFSNITTRLTSNKGRIRQFQADFLAYSLIDTIVDSYFVVMEELSEKIEEIEHETELNPRPETLKLIHKLKREVVFLKKVIWPLREVINSFERGTADLTKPSTKIYLRDVYDHIINLLDMTETNRDMLSSLFDVYMSSISNKINEVMKLLTVIGTIFIPLTFITSLYGMNFKHMPELYWDYGYYSVLSFMLFLFLGMVAYFKKNKWI